MVREIKSLIHIVRGDNVSLTRWIGPQTPPKKAGWVEILSMLVCKSPTHITRSPRRPEVR